MLDNNQTELPKATPDELKKSFNFRDKLALFLLSDGEKFPDYYEVQKGYGVPDPENQAQVCLKAEYESIKHNTVGEDSAEQLLIPLISKRSIAISAPPLSLASLMK